jgi:O-methyltransferase involved in polyketide biosynthesis
MEGVTMYLTRPVLRATVADVAALSSPGDRFVLSYAPRGADAKHASGAIMSRTVKRFNEPFVGLIDAAELHAILEEHGFAILADEGSAHWSRRFTPAVAATPPRPTERIVTARYRDDVHDEPT